MSEYVSNFGFYRKNSLNTTTGTGDNVTYVIHFAQQGSGDTADYPWVNKEYYELSCGVDVMPYGITFNNSTHQFEVDRWTGAGIYPEENLSGLYNPVQLSCTYNDGVTTLTKVLKFVFVVDDETASQYTDQNVLLLGHESNTSVITISQIPNNSRVMIKKFDKETGAGLTDWCDVMGYSKIQVPILSGEWLGVKNGNLNLQILTSGGINYVVDNGKSSDAIHIDISKTTGGIISGNIRSQGCPYFQCEKLNEVDKYTVPVNIWGKYALYNLFQSSKFKEVSDNLFSNCYIWNAPSGCYNMFYSSYIRNSPTLYDPSDGQGWRDQHLFHSMFRACNSLTGNIGTIQNYSSYCDHACQGMFASSKLTGFSFTNPLSCRTSNVPYAYIYGSEKRLSTITYSESTPATDCFSEMYAACTNLLQDSTGSFSVGNIGTRAYYAMFSGCSNLITFNGKFNFETKIPQNPNIYSSFQYMFYSCSKLYQFNFGISSQIDDQPTPGICVLNNMFSNMFHDCTSLYKVQHLRISGCMAYGCQNMFANCNSLKTNGITISGQVLGTGAYAGMFQGCKNLEMIDRLVVPNTTDYCCRQMFYGCTSFTNNNNHITITNVTSPWCYAAMFGYCTALRWSPIIKETQVNNNPNSPARTYCFSHMFCGCSSLTNVNLTCLASLFMNGSESVVGGLAGGQYEYMFQNCTSLNFLSNTTNYDYSYEDDGLNSLPIVGCGIKSTSDVITMKGMFQGCSSLKSTPVMLGITKECYPGAYNYADTFSGCSNLEKIILITANDLKNDTKVPAGITCGTFLDIPRHGQLYTNQPSTVCDLTSSVPIWDTYALTGWTNKYTQKWYCN